MQNEDYLETTEEEKYMSRNMPIEDGLEYSKFTNYNECKELCTVEKKKHYLNVFSSL